MHHFIMPFVTGIIVTIAIIIYYNYNIHKKKHELYGFTWIRYPVRKYTHMYIGDYLYVCERVPYVKNKMEKIINESN